jgi:hypothetical protein
MTEQNKKKGTQQTLKLDTPQQDKDWSEEQKIAWVKTSTKKILTVFTGGDKD